MHVGDVQADDRDRGDRGVGRAVPQVGQGQDQRPAGGQPDRVGRRPGPLVHPVPEVRAGQRAVAGERVDHPGVRGDRGHPAEQLGADDHEQQQLGAGVADRGGPDLGRRHQRAGVVRVVRGLDRERDADQQHPAGDQRDHDRHHDAARAAARGVVRLLGHVRRGVVPGEACTGPAAGRAAARRTCCPSRCC